MGNRPLFRLGRCVATPGALEDLEESENTAEELLRRHQTGDWGDLGQEDKATNEDALKTGGRIFSAYILSTGVKIWLITEWDRSATTILLPSEY